MLTHDGKDRIEFARAMVDGSESEEMRAHWLSELKQSWPGASCGGGDEPDWDKRDLVKLYEDINFRGSLEGTRLLPGEFTEEFLDFKNLPSHRTTWVKRIFIHTSYNGQEVNTANETRLEEKLHWQVVVPEYSRCIKRQKKASDNVRLHNWSMPLLLGSQHANRFRRNTKVYVLFGEHRGRHGVVVGHEVGFSVKSWGSGDGKSPMLKILMVHRETGDLEIKDIRQEVVKLVDLHGLLPFGVPMLDPSIANTEIKERRLDDRIRAYPHVSKIVVAKKFWEDERDSYWDFQRDVVTRKNSGT